jgi:Zn-dependent peptidase ImmA (M78 family)
VITRAIEQQAEVLLARHGVVRPPVAVELMAQAEGIQVLRSSSTGNESGFLLRDHHHTFMGVNSRHSDLRQRFTIAHAFGHWQLHPGRPLTIDHLIRIKTWNEVSSAATDLEEMEANAFVAALLMPAALVDGSTRRNLDLGVNTVEAVTKKLASEFAVSTQAMSWRLIDLGIISSY